MIDQGGQEARASDLPRFQYRPTNLQVEQVGSLKIVAAACSLARFSPDSRWLFTAAGDEALVWDTGEFHVKKGFNKAPIYAFSQDSLHLAVYQPVDDQVQVVELETGQVTDRLALPPGNVSSLHFSSTAAELVIELYPRYNPDALDRYDRMREEEAFYVTLPVVGRQAAAAQAQREKISPNTRYAVGNRWGGTSIHDLDSDTTVYRTTEFVRTICFSQDSRYVLIITGRYAQVLKLPEGTVVRHIAGPRYPNVQEGYSLPDTVWVLDRANDLLIDGVTGKTVQGLAELGAPKLGRIAVSPEGRYVAGMDSIQRTLRIWDSNTGQVILQENDRFRASDELKFSPNSAVLLVQGDPVVLVIAR